MEVHGAVSHRFDAAASHARNSEAHSARLVASDAKAERKASPDSVNLSNDCRVSAEDQTENASGVMRLLQEGHFRGVSDVRLRINFHDQISALEAAETASRLDAGIQDLTENLDSELKIFLEANTLDAEPAASFDEAAKQLFSDVAVAAYSYSSGDVKSIDSLLLGLQDAFDKFAESVRGLTVEDSPEEAPDANLTAVSSEALSTSDGEGVDNPTLSDVLDTFLTEIGGTFSSSLLGLKESLSDVQVLPELSGPNGNGKAYDKFLSMYNALSESSEGSPQPDQFDAVA